MRIMLTMANIVLSIISYIAPTVYIRFTVIWNFEIQICFARFDFFEISTPLMRIMLTMANIV